MMELHECTKKQGLMISYKELSNKKEIIQILNN